MTKRGAAIRWSEAKLKEHQERQKPCAFKRARAAGDESPAPKKTRTAGIQALGRLPAGTMNDTEAAYDAVLAADPLIVWRKFEGIKLRLADNTFYTPDFFVMRFDCALEVHEVKGFWTDDARVKIKVAAALYPILKFVAVQKVPKKQGGGWSVEEF